MARRRIRLSDWLQGAVRSARHGTIMDPLATQAHVNAVHDQRVVGERERSFGSGGIGGNPTLWTAPVHGMTDGGRPVTVSFGLGKNEGHTLIADGHVGMSEFYGKANKIKGHDHYLIDGTTASRVDRKRFLG